MGPVRLWLLTVAAMLALTIAAVFDPVPACPEDSVLVGQGTFTAGRWSEYRCGPAFDDYQGD